MVLGFIHHYHDVIGWLVVHQQLAVTVVDTTTRGVLYFLQEGIRIRTLLVVITRNLEHEETDDVHHHNEQCHTTNHKASVVQ